MLSTLKSSDNNRGVTLGAYAKLFTADVIRKRVEGFIKCNVNKRPSTDALSCIGRVGDGDTVWTSLGYPNPRDGMLDVLYWQHVIRRWTNKTKDEWLPSVDDTTILPMICTPQMCRLMCVMWTTGPSNSRPELYDNPEEVEKLTAGDGHGGGAGIPADATAANASHDSQYITNVTEEEKSAFDAYSIAGAMVAGILFGTTKSGAEFASKFEILSDHARGSISTSNSTPCFLLTQMTLGVKVADLTNPKPFLRMIALFDLESYATLHAAYQDETVMAELFSSESVRHVGDIFTALNAPSRHSFDLEVSSFSRMAAAAEDVFEENQALDLRGAAEKITEAMQGSKMKGCYGSIGIPNTPFYKVCDEKSFESMEKLVKFCGFATSKANNVTLGRKYVVKLRAMDSYLFCYVATIYDNIKNVYKTDELNEATKPYIKDDEDDFFM